MGHKFPPQWTSPTPSHTLLLADVRRCRVGVWTAEMFIEWRKLGDAMWGLASLVMLKNDQEAGKHGVFWDGGHKSVGGTRNFSELRGQPGSQNHKLMGGRQSTHLCPVALLSCVPILETVPPPSEPLLGLPGH